MRIDEGHTLIDEVRIDEGHTLTTITNKLDPE